MKMKDFFLDVNELLKFKNFDNFDNIFSICNALYRDECDDESLNKEVEYDKCNEKDKKTGTPTIAERLKEVCQTKEADKKLEDAFTHVKNAVLEAIEGDFSNNAKYAEILPDKGIRFTNDPIIDSIRLSSKKGEFTQKIMDDLGFGSVETVFSDTRDPNNMKIKHIDLLFKTLL